MFELQLLSAKSVNDLIEIHADENVVDLMQAAGVSVPLCVRNFDNELYLTLYMIIFMDKVSEYNMHVYM